MQEPRTARTRRIDVRVAEEEKGMIEHAAALSGVGISDYVRQRMLEHSREVISDHEIVTLTREGSLALAEALTNPPEPNEALRSLLSRESGISSTHR
jgi:uncharacterized protein (DUF1778 family)